MAIIKSFSPFQNLSNFSTFIVDRNPNSDFFRITEFKETFSGGKNGFLIEGSEFLKETTEVKIEILDVEGNPVYFEPGKGIPDYYEGVSSLVSVHVYPDTPIGIGKITVLGELKEYINENGTLLPIPNEWKGVYNVKWERTFKINRNISNEDTVRFYRRPLVSISELVKPIFSKTIPSVTQSGSLEGIALQPTAGSNLSTWTAGTIYKLKITDGGSWTGSVDENIINLPSLPYSPTVREVLNSKEILVDVPYSIGNIVTNFSATPYTTSFEFLENQTIDSSALTGSFAKINISNLKTFVGDVARVKVFRKSRNEVTDFQFVQESKLESTELLRDITLPNDTEISYGNFTQTNLSNYWVTSSNSHPVSINVDVLQSAVKTDYNFSAGGIQQLITSESFSITKDVEYTLTFKTLISGSLNGSEYLRGYLSASDGYQQTFLNISGSDIYKTRQIVSQNIIANPISASNAKLVFDISGSDWYISNISLKNAQETSFSPDEFVLIQDIPRKLESETFDFRFEFYDINNNYVPVDVVASATFDGGNDFPTSAKILTLQSDRNAFRFFTGSIANPPFQQIGFTTTRQNIAGDITYDRSVFDITGSYISEAQYLSLGGTEYPGRLHTSSSAGFVVQLDEFSGSLDTSTTSLFRVGFITYTASADGLEDYETIYRLEDGDNAPGLFASSTANQFIYKATDLSLNPTGQVIVFDVRRKNLSSVGSPIIINSGSQVGTGPALNLLFDDPTTGVATYFLSGSTYNFLSGSTTYVFTSSDSFGIDYHDQIKITPVKILDGLSVNLTNENASLPALSTGFVSSGSFVATSGSVSVKVGAEDISRQEGLTTNNRFDIISASGVNCTPNDDTPDDSTYGITTLTADSGSLTLLVRYKDGAGDTTDVTKVVTYSKSKRGVPNVEVAVTPTAQSIQSNSRGSGSATPQTLTVTALEGGIDRFTGFGSITPTNGLTINSSSPPTITFTSNASSMTSDSGTVTIPVNFTDSENVSGTKNVVATISRVRSSAPVVNISANPQSQTVTSGSLVGIGTPTNVTVVVNEGGSNYTYNTSGANTFNITGVTNATNNGNGTITPNTPSSISGTSGVITISYRNSEGTSFTGKTIDFVVGVNGIGSPGATGATGAAGANGANGAAGSNGVVINVSPPSQTISRSTSGVFDTPAIFTVTVSENGTLLTHQAGTGTPSTSYFTITSLSNGTLTAGSGTTTPDITPSTPSSTAGLTTTFNVTYTDSKGTTSSAIAQSHVVSVALDGSTGPGVVHTGIWASGRAYQYSDGLTDSTGRRDTVLWSSTGSPPYDTYYATNTSHTSTNNSSTSTGRPDLGGPWTSLGTQDFFVAAKIGIFEESYVQNTLNIGTNNNGGVSSANITLAGSTSNPYISIGQSGTVGSQGYNITGIFLGQDSGTSKLSLKSATNSLTWDGTNLNIVGNLSVGSTVPNTVVTGLGALATQSSVSTGQVTGLGTLATQNTVSTGQVTGLGALATLSTVTNTELAANAVTEGKIATDAVTSGKISANAIVADKIAANAIVADKIATNAITAGKIAAGSVTADKITVSELSALGATIGGWSISNTAISKTTGGQGTITLDSSNNKIVLSDTSATRFEVNTSTSLTIPTTSTDRKTLISNAGFLVARDDERYFRHITDGAAPIGGKSFVFNDTKGGFRTDILTFHTPVLSEDYLKFPTSSANLDNDSLLPYQIVSGTPNLSFPIWMPRTSEVIMYDRPGDPGGGYQAGSQPYNAGGLQTDGGTTIGGTTFRIHTGVPENDSTFGGVTLPLRFRIDRYGSVQIPILANGTITTINNIGQLSTSSDKNLKIDAGFIENGLDKVLALKPRYFYWKNDTSAPKKQLGFYAQEVNEVSEETANTPAEGGGWGIYDRGLIAILTKAIQELSEKVEKLEAKISGSI